MSDHDTPTIENIEPGDRIRTCTMHPIVILSHLSSYLLYIVLFFPVSNIDQIQVPSNIDEALSDPNQKADV